MEVRARAANHHEGDPGGADGCHDEAESAFAGHDRRPADIPAVLRTASIGKIGVGVCAWR